MSTFVHLHVHSHYSLLDGLPKIPELVKVAKERGFSALALTDHGNMYGAIEFYEACEKEGIKPIVGMEAYVAPGSRFDKNSRDHKYFHLILLAANEQGYRNLMKLASLANLEGFYYKPRVDKEILRQYHEGIIASSACMSGEIPWILRKENNLEKAKSVALGYQEIFGENNFYLELMDLPAQEGQMDLNTKLIQISKETGIPLIVTRDVHYLNPDDAEAQDILTCIRDGRIIDEPDRQSMAGVDYSLAKGDDIAKRFKHIPEVLENTVKIAERTNLKLDLNKWHFPTIELPPGKTDGVHLRELVHERLPKLTAMTEEVRKRADYELDVIIKKGYCPYFLVVADYVNYARTHGIAETTRGSGAGSIVAYALGITTVNPLFFNLPFERFLNPHRPSAPDIDADFADDRRDEMIEYVTKVYGADKVAQIITFGTMMARGSVRDVGRALGYSYSFCDQVAKMIPFGAQGFEMTIEKALDLTPELKELYAKNPQVHRLLDLARKIEGCARHHSMHAAGVVISPTPLTDFSPIQFDTEGKKVITQYEMHSVEAAGLLKMDFLGIRNLSILGHAVEIIEKTTGEKIDIYNLPWDDKKTYDMLARGETMSVFQLSGSGMTRYLRELQPSTIFDIMVMIALFRPGPMANIPEYIARKHGKNPVVYYHPKMEKYLDKSFGILVYQDDLMFTAIELAGYDWTTVDKLRKAVGKKIPEEMAKQHDIFVKGCKKHSNISAEDAEKIWNLFEPFQGYGFNKAHAASYAVVAYQTAYLKAHYPVQYMTAVLIAESGDMDKVPAVIHECDRMGVKVLPPDVNESFKNFAMISPDDGNVHIRFGLNGIKNLGEHIADVIYRERKNNGRYANLDDFLKRVKDKDLNKKSLESLIKCGAVDSFGYDRNLLLANIENLLAFARQTQESTTAPQHSLFAGTTIDVSVKIRLEPAPNATEENKLTWEKELLGLYVTAHPFTFFEKKMQRCLTLIKDLQAQERNQWVVVGGVIDNTKKKITRNGQPMMFVTIQDTSGALELLVFPRTYEATKDVWVEGNIVCVVGRTSEDEGDDKLFVEKAHTMTKDNVDLLVRQMAVGQQNVSALKQKTPRSAGAQTGESESAPSENAIYIIVAPADIKTKSEPIKEVLRKYPGDSAVYIQVGDKKIKTSFKVNARSNIKEELENMLGAGSFTPISN